MSASRASWLIFSARTPCAMPLQATTPTQRTPPRMPMGATRPDKRSSKRSPRKAVAKPAAKVVERAGLIAMTLAQLYPTARISLDFETPWQCLAATILSAQSTDVGVNKVTPHLFKEYPDAR